MAVNNAQGQKLKRGGIYPPSPGFSHGQLYVYFSLSSPFDNVAIAIIEGRQHIKIIDW
jgi:hypothetical protein